MGPQTMKTLQNLPLIYEVYYKAITLPRYLAFLGFDFLLGKREPK